MTPKLTCWMLAAVLCVACDGCGGGSTPGERGELGTTGPLSGRVIVDGSSTVLPVSRAMADAFEKAHPAVQVSVQSSGTGGGFRKFCAGDTDITGASRPINRAESRTCQEHQIDFIELPVAFDSLSVVVNAQNAFASCLSVAELKTMWEPAAEGRVTRWNQIRSSFPDQALSLFGPGTDSGTFDYFTLAIVGDESKSRSDYTKSEDDTVLVNGIEGDRNALGYFGFAYYLANRDKLKLVAIDNGRGCVVPSAQTVDNHTYQPLARPMFIYVKTSSSTRPETHAFARFYLDPDNMKYVREIGYVPLTAATLTNVAQRLESSVTGSMFGARGSVLGVTADVFSEDDKVKNVLVQ
jgi:phosphate transport system substrate-binding protein